MTPLRFRRCQIHYRRPSAPTEKQLKNAARALEKHRQSWGLFQDTVELQTPEQRLSDIDASWNAWAKDFRNKTAAGWRRVRAILNALPPDERDELVGEWNRNGCPAEACYLLEFLRSKGVLPPPVIYGPEVVMHYEKGR